MTGKIEIDLFNSREHWIRIQNLQGYKTRISCSVIYEDEEVPKNKVDKFAELHLEARDCVVLNYKRPYGIGQKSKLILEMPSFDTNNISISVSKHRIY